MLKHSYHFQPFKWNAHRIAVVPYMFSVCSMLHVACPLLLLLSPLSDRIKIEIEEKYMIDLPSSRIL